jgi:1,2-phenylacetyl-CoA epoxidase PaaB subunit
MTSRHKKIDQQRERGGVEPRYYEVFARKTSADALSHVGSVEAPNDDLAQIRAWYIYDQHRWKEMCVVPLEAIITVTEHDRSTKIKMN